VNPYKERLARLRASMKLKDIDAYIILNTDPHLGEYIPEHWRIIPWLTGFTGSSSIVIVARKFAGLWTDSRYFLQAESQLSGSGFSLKKLNVPSEKSWLEWIGEKVKKGSRIGVDGRIFSFNHLENLKRTVDTTKIEIDISCDLISEIWNDRPAMPFSIAFDHNVAFSGKERSSKIKEVRDQMKRLKADWHFLTSVDDIMWLLNIRGNDLPYSPLLFSFALIRAEQILLFVDEKKIPIKLAMEFDRLGITILPYNESPAVLSRLKKGSTLLLDSSKINASLYDSVSDKAIILRDITIPARLKAIKNQTEIENVRCVMVKDGVALTKFFFWLEKSLTDQKITELSASEKLHAFRLQQADCTGASFQTISAYREHGALAHYNATPASDYILSRAGIFLVDSGGQYLNGTTDITRTVSLGQPDKQQKSDFTLVLKGFIKLASAKFPAGTTGHQLDILARKSLWDSGLNYGHGTGHGVGYYLNVHEGPFSIGTNPPTDRQSALVPGLIFSDEPAIYRDGQYGIRIENLLLVTESCKNEFGQFLSFENLSICYIDTALIEKSLLDKNEIAWINNYHSIVYERLASLLDEEERSWLRMKTGEI
jgi:Xaa-Pro aminopeptidase